MQILGRSLARVVRVPFGRHHWIAAANMLRVYEQPLDAAKRYILATGSYPRTFRLRTPTGTVSVTAYSFHDVMTVNEIFCRRDYRIEPTDRVVVDFGSNIGISALYFLTHAPQSFVYCYEPLPRNCERLNRTLENFRGRYRLSVNAVAPHAGQMNFHYEETGRYGGVGLGFSQQMVVDCLGAPEVIAAVLKDHEKIDVLKIDIEGLEARVMLSLPNEQRQRIEKIYAETRFKTNPLAATHTMRQYGTIMQFHRRQS